MSAPDTVAARRPAASSGRSIACRTCPEGRVEEFMDLGRMPIANGFLKAEARAAEEFFFRLAAGVCTSCWMAQLMETVPPSQLFHEHYVYFSSTSTRMQEHFAGFADDVLQRLGLPNPSEALIAEVGSNDGILLEPMRRRGARVLGIEPSANVAAVARERGIDTWTEFFTPALADRIVRERGRLHALLGANVICHIPDLQGLFEGASRALADEGIFVFEDPSLLEILRTTAYDQIYDEHVYYFSVTSLSAALARHGLRLFDVQAQPVHGGSNRIYACRQASRHATHARVAAALDAEQRFGLSSRAPYQAFAHRVQRSRAELTALLTRLKSEGRRIAGYGATSKGNVVLNYCQIGPDLLEYITDTTPIKQGCVSPGMHIPIVKPDVFHQRPPEYALLLAWNHAQEILRKEEAYGTSGGRFITHIPTVKVITP